MSEPLLGIHLLGGSYGESIVVELPDGGWGVVDCFGPANGERHAHPTAEFLQARGVRKLRFCLLTHPHRDHYMGFDRLVELFHVEQFWRFGAATPASLCRWARFEPGASVEERHAALHLWRLFDVVTRLREERRDFVVARVGAHQDLLECGDRANGTLVSIRSLAPSGNSIERIEEQLARCFSDGRLLDFRQLPRLNEANSLSVVLRIQFGSAVAILGADLERDGWREILENPSVRPPPLAAAVVKVPHHGSRTGYCDGLWRRLANDRRPLALVASSTSHRLPDPYAVEHMQSVGADVWATTSADGRPAERLGRIEKSALALASGQPSPRETSSGARLSAWLNSSGAVVRFEASGSGTHLGEARPVPNTLVHRPAT